MNDNQIRNIEEALIQIATNIEKMNWNVGAIRKTIEHKCNCQKS